jgi:hypothetical protein
MAKLKRLRDIYRFPGFVPLPTVRGIFGEPAAVVVSLQRRRKNLSAAPAGKHAKVMVRRSPFHAMGVRPRARAACPCFGNRTIQVVTACGFSSRSNSAPSAGS